MQPCSRPLLALIALFAAAISALSEHDDIEVLLSDVVMPEMSGVELGQKLRELQPELVEVFTSGYPPELVPDLPAGADFIEKPFSGRELSQLVDQLLERRRGDAS